jgi:hypothetical protein
MRANSRGEHPATRVNAVVNALADWYPTLSATSANDRRSARGAAIDRLNEALLAPAAEAKLPRTDRIRAQTTVVPANVAYPTDSITRRRICRIPLDGLVPHPTTLL